MKKTKQILTMLLIIISAMIYFSVNSFALTEGDWEFQLLDDEVEITGYLGEGGDVVIPDTIYGRPVTKVCCEKYGKDLSNATSIKYSKNIKIIDCITTPGLSNKKTKSVILPEGVEKIADYAFRPLKALENVNLPSTLKIIGSSAFGGCSNLDNIIFPDGLTEIGDSAFAGTGLTSVDLSNTSASIGDGVFAGCSKLISVKLPDNITRISNNLFDGCVSLTDIELPSTVEIIDTEAFKDCHALEKIILPVSLKEIDSYDVFLKCKSLKEIVIPYGTKSIGKWAFRMCENLKSIFIPDTITFLSHTILADSPNAIVYCTSDSYTAKHCKENKISYLTDNSVNSAITVLYNGTRISFHSYGQNPELLESRTLVPLRSIFEAMGAEVEWDASSNTAVAKRDGVEIRIQIGADEMYKDGQAIPVDVPAQLMNSRTMVPVRVIAEAFGADVQWNANGKTVLITE